MKFLPFLRLDFVLVVVHGISRVNIGTLVLVKIRSMVMIVPARKVKKTAGSQQNVMVVKPILQYQDATSFEELHRTCPNDGGLI